MKKSDMTFSPYQLELLGDFIVRISQFLVLPKKKGLPALHFGVGFVSLRILILKYPLI